jgi:outer membrane protein assembly factor BamB
MVLRSRRWWWCACALLVVAFTAHPRLQSSLDEQLVVAAAKGDVSTVADLLKKGADVGATNEYGTTPLYFAADQANLPLVRLLLDHGADANRLDLYYGKSPIRLAAIPYSGVTENETRAEIIELMLAKGFGTDGEPLTDLIRGGYFDAAREIIGRGRVEGPYLNTALDAARRMKQNDLADQLVMAGAKDPGPLDSARSPQRIKLLTGIYRNQSGDLLTVTQGLHDDDVLLERAGRGRVVLLPAGLTLLRSADMKVALTMKPGILPPAEVTLKEGTHASVFVRSADAPARRADAAGPTPSRPDALRAPATGAPPVAPVRRTREWPSFRGVHASGNGDGMNPPTTWDLEKGINLKWKTPIPGLAHSSPVIWGNRVFITTAVPQGNKDLVFRPGGGAGPGASAYTKDDVLHSWRVYALDKESGRILWERVSFEGVPKTARHVMQSQADSTPATDGTHLVVFLGSEGLYCYNMDGKLLWKRDLGPLHSGRFTDPSYQWKTSSSPIIYKNLVILQVDLMKDGFIVALDVKTGKDVWRTERDEVPSWATPLLYEGPPRTELITAGTRFARAYDPATGKELWRLGGHSELPTPTPIAGRGLIFLTSGSGNTVQPIYAVRPGGNGDITLKEDQASNEWVVWSRHRGGPFLPTPLVYGDLLYLSSDSGILTAYDTQTGSQVYQERLTRGGSYTASGVAADGKLYYANEDGAMVVVKAGPAFAKLAENPMGEVILASPAISPGMLVVRMQHHVVAIAESSSTR